MPKHHSANAPRLAQVFWPLSTQPSPAAFRAAPRADAGEVAAGVGLGPALAPDLVARRHRRQEARLLRVGAVLEHGRREQEDAVLAHPLRRPGAVVLLLEDEPLEDADVAAAVLGRPADDGPAVVEHGALPGAVGLEAVGRIERGERVGRDVRLQPGPGLGPEGLVLGAEGQVHGGRESRTAASGLPRCPGVPARLSRPSARGWCATRVRTKKSTTSRTMAASSGASPRVDEPVAALGHDHQLVRDAVGPEVPGQLLGLLGVDDLVVVRGVEDAGRADRRARRT